MIWIIAAICVLGCSKKEAIVDRPPKEPTLKSIQLPHKPFSAADLTEEEMDEFLTLFKNLATTFSETNASPFILSRQNELLSARSPSEIDQLIKEKTAEFLSNDHAFINRLTLFEEGLTRLQNKYGIKDFTPEQWKDLIKVAHKNGVYFFPGAKQKILGASKKKIINGASLQGFEDTPCADKYEQIEDEIGLIMLSGALSCAAGGFSLGALVCWGGLAAYYVIRTDYLENTFWCECMISRYGMCLS